MLPWPTMQNSLGQTSPESPFATALKQLKPPSIVLQLLQDWAEAFKEYCEGNWKLIDSLSIAGW